MEGRLPFSILEEKDFLQSPQRHTNWGYFYSQISCVNILQREERDGTACPATKCNILFAGAGFELIHRVFKRENHHFDFNKGGLAGELVRMFLHFTKPAGLALKIIHR